MTYGLTEKGFFPKSYSEVIEDLKSRAKSIFGEDVDLTSTSPLYQLLRICAFEVSVLWQSLEDVFYGNFLATAEGSQLSMIAETYGLSRNPAIKATGGVKFSRSTPADKDYLIASGTTIQTNPYLSSVYRFNTQNDVTLEASATVVSATVIAQQPSVNYNVAANQIQYFFDTVYGIESVNNPVAVTGGQDVESDASLRYRLRDAFYKAGKGTVGSLEAAIRDTTGVKDTRLVENTASHTAVAYVYGGEYDTVSGVIATYRPIGIPVSLLRPIEFSIDVSATVGIKGAGATASIISYVEDNLSTYFSNLYIGDNVEHSDVLKQILDTESIDRCYSLNVTGKSSTISSLGSEITIPASGVAIAGTYNITEQ